ncbi:gag-pol polyprotein, partial [Trifolium medium]|nr:gag-pol polyprotein [Trifolium medium]
MDFPIKNVLRKPDLAGRMAAWSVELSEFDITFAPRGAIKSQMLADFVLEMSTPPGENSAQPWTLSVDGASNIRGSGAGVVLEDPDGVLIEQSLRFSFKASNNQAEYEALIAGMKLAKEMENSRADLLSKLASTKRPGSHRTFIQETISRPSINEEQTVMVVEADDWRSPIIRYLQRDELPPEKEEAVKIKKM